MNNGNTFFKMSEITKSFPGVVALKGVNFYLKEGEVHCLVGENGAGKSTLIKIISGVYSQDSGEISIDGEVTHFHSPHDAQQAGVNTVYQELDLVPTMTIAENIFLGQETLGKLRLLDKNRAIVESRALLKELEVDVDPRTRVDAIGVGLQQIVAIAKAISRKCRILILDEPSAALSIEQVSILFATIRRLKTKGIGIIYISHRLEEIFQIGDRVSILRDGDLVQTTEVENINSYDLIKSMIGRSLEDQYVKVEKMVRDEIVFSVRDLNRDGILRDISFDLYKGEILGICGLTGSGRTELARAIVGVDPKDSGTILLENNEIKIKNTNDAVKLGIGLIPEDRKEQGVILSRSVYENIILPLLTYNTYTKWGVLLDRLLKTITSKQVSSLKIKVPNMRQLAQNLSGGNQQKTVLAKWLASNCKLLIFDEPTRGIDVGAKREIYTLMNSLIAEGVSIIMISSELPEILGRSDRILIMSEGKIIDEYKTTEVNEEKLMHVMGKR